MVSLKGCAPLCRVWIAPLPVGVYGEDAAETVKDRFARAEPLPLFVLRREPGHPLLSKLLRRTQ